MLHHKDKIPPSEEISPGFRWGVNKIQLSTAVATTVITASILWVGNGILFVGKEFIDNSKSIPGLQRRMSENEKKDVLQDKTDAIILNVIKQLRIEIDQLKGR